MAAVRKVVDFRPPVRRRIHEDVAEQLRNAILDGRFPAGSKLPPERELATEFQVNRTSLREAIKVLEGLGLVRVRQGDGATVQPIVDASLEVLPSMIFHGGKIDQAVILEMSEVMRPLLYEMARLALERSTDDDIDRLRALRRRIGDAEREQEERFAAGRDLIVYLSDMTGNRVWQMLARRARAMLASEPMHEARRRLRRDPGEIGAMIDECIDHRNAGRHEEAHAALKRAIQFVGHRALDENLPGRGRTRSN